MTTSLLAGCLKWLNPTKFDLDNYRIIAMTVCEAFIL